MKRSLFAMLGVLGLAAVPGLTWSRDLPEKKVTPTEAKLLEIVANYKKWGRIDDSPKFAPTLCRAPDPSTPFRSASTDDATHGRKLYFLFARDSKAYRADKAVPEQIVVKEAWVPEEVKTESDDRRLPRPSKEDEAIGHYRDGDKAYRASKQAGLFIMMKLDPKTPDTDEGWIYATTDSERKKITQYGKIESCMKCHVDAKNDRLFGLPKPAKK